MESGKPSHELPTEFVPKEAVESEKAKTTEFTLKAETMKDLLKRDIPKPEYIIAPWLCVGESALVSARAGVGKTFFGMEIAKAITLTGSAFAGRWEAPRLRRVVYLDGEMGDAAMKNRGTVLNLDTEFFFYVDALNQEGTQGINLATPLSQAAVMNLLKHHEADVLIIDNLNTLYKTIEKPNSAEYMDALNPFILKLRKEKIAVVIIDHEGKSNAGGPRGTSAKTDILHVAITLERPESVNKGRGGARFIVRFTKTRGFHGEDAEPFVAELYDGEWEVFEVSDILDSENESKPESSLKKRKSEAFQMFDEGDSVSAVMEKLNVPKSTAYDYSKEWKAKNRRTDTCDDLPETHAETDASA